MDLLTQQREEREERILVAARDLIGDVGYEGVTIRALARRSRVSVPTLYKLFGDKDALLLRAVEDQFTAVLQSIEADSSLEGLDLIVALTDGCCREIIRTARYARAVLAVFVRSGQTSEVMAVVARDLTLELGKALEQMRRTRQLAAWVDPKVLSERLAAHQLMVCLEWESGSISNKALGPTMSYGMCMMLLGAARGAGQRRLHALAAEVQGPAGVRRASGRGPRRRSGAR